MIVEDAIARCLIDFPELSERYEQEELSSAVSLGGYIFFEDYFNEFVSEGDGNMELLQRVGVFIEMMAASPDIDTQNLAQIGVLEGLVNRRAYGIAKFLGASSRDLLIEASHRTRVDKDIWLP